MTNMEPKSLKIINIPTGTGTFVLMDANMQGRVSTTNNCLTTSTINNAESANYYIKNNVPIIDDAPITTANTSTLKDTIYKFMQADRTVSYTLNCINGTWYINNNDLGKKMSLPQHFLDKKPNRYWADLGFFMTGVACYDLGINVTLATKEKLLLNTFLAYTFII